MGIRSLSKFVKVFNLNVVSIFSVGDVLTEANFDKRFNGEQVRILMRFDALN